MRRAMVMTVATTRAKQLIARLVVLDSGSTALVPGTRLDIEPITTIGRAPTNTIVLDSTFVSTEHTRILYKDRSLWVEDFGSRNGTLVDQQTIAQAVAAAPGSILPVGDVRFKFPVSRPGDGAPGTIPGQAEQRRRHHVAAARARPEPARAGHQAARLGDHRPRLLHRHGESDARSALDS